MKAGGNIERENETEYENIKRIFSDNSLRILPDSGRYVSSYLWTGDGSDSYIGSFSDDHAGGSAYSYTGSKTYSSAKEKRTGKGR